MLTDDLPGTGGRIKELPEDFVVEEIPSYLPCGEGDHVMVLVEKRSMNTDEVARVLASAAEVRVSEVGFAGRKDKHAVTSQWFSVPATKAPGDLAALEGESFKVLEAARHRNKLKTGHLRGNRFTVVVRGVAADAQLRARDILERIEREGLPNTFGPQRFGRGGENVRATLAWLAGERRRPKDSRRRRLQVSALQSLLFNRVVERRIQGGLLSRALRGDVAKLHTTGGMFVVEDVEEVTARIKAREVSPTGPIFGARMWWPEHDALDLESSTLEQAGLDRAFLERFRKDGRGSRRLARVFPEGMTVHHEGDTMTLAFTLDAGAFATTLLAEVTKAPELKCPVDLDPRPSVEKQLDHHTDEFIGFVD